ncbi:MAG: DUF4388 domain-containing protein [bacterium]|nr:DUF4388 domain-containing protein [bacterium]
MALEGTLRDFSFADILQLISLQRKTGVLTLKNEENVVTISFMEGRIIGASSLNQHEEDRLGLILLKSGAVTETELEAALRRQEETLQRLGRILIDHQVVPVDNVRVALEQQILQIVYRVFRWDDGEYHFSQETDIDYDRELMLPMAADSIIMEGARMTDEWPFIIKRIPSREIIFIKVDPSRTFDVVAEEESDFDDLSFSFTESPDDKPVAEEQSDKLTEGQLMAYELVNGKETVTELIQSSPLIEFETCRALADLVDRGLIRPATDEEIVRLLRLVEEDRPATGFGMMPWLAIPFLILLGFSLTVMTANPLSATFGLKELIWNRYVQEGVSWYSMERLARAAEDHYFLHGLYPENSEMLLIGEDEASKSLADPWGQPYRLVNRGHKMMVTGLDSSGHPVPLLLLSRALAWEGSHMEAGVGDGPGVIFIE